MGTPGRRRKDRRNGFGKSAYGGLLFRHLGHPDDDRHRLDWYVAGEARDLTLCQSRDLGHKSNDCGLKSSGID